MFDVSRYKDLEYLIIMEARNDPTFKADLLKAGNAKKAIESRFMITLPQEVDINVIQDAKNKFTLVLPPDDADKVLGTLKQGMYW